jgi:drug/metabolite transporter (DMT)-like permease
MSPPPDPGRTRTRLALAGLVLFWGANFSVVKYALRDLAPLPFTTLRFLLASAILGLLLRLSGDRVRIDRADWPRVIALGLVGTTAYQSLFIYGISWSLAGNASLMLATGPIFTTLLALAFRQEKGSPAVAVGVGCSVAGVALVVLGGAAGVSFSTGTLAGDLIVLVAAFCWSLFTVGSAPLVQRYGVGPMTAATMWVGTLGLSLVSLPGFIAQNWGAVRPAAWLAVAYSGTFAIATAYFLWSYCVRQIGSTRTTVYTNATPMVAILVAWLTLGETPTLLQLAGAGAIVAGTILVRLGKIERSPLGR